MASPTPRPNRDPNQNPKSQPQPLKPPGRPRQPDRDELPEVVDPVWIIKAIGFTLIAALLCGYATLCLLFYQGQWQLVLHPARSAAVPASIGGARFETVRFGVDETGLPQLTGWWIPAEPEARYAAETVLYLPSGDGSLTDAVPTLAALHAVGINVFAFDYRGYGASAATHPNQRRMTEDADSAWQYLTVSRAQSPAKIIPFGYGVGAALAVRLAANHAEVPAVILESPRPDLIEAVRADPRTRSLPVGSLFHERFEIAAPVTTLKTPKLFLLEDGSSVAIRQMATFAATPKVNVTLRVADKNGPGYRDQIVRFMDQYLGP